MTIGSRINSFLGIDKRFLRNKLKKELKKYDDTIQEMVAYESAHNYICTIMENLNPKTKKTFLKKVYEMHTLNSEDLLLIAKETQNKNLYNILKKENVIFNYVETTMVLKMLKAQHNKLPKSKIKNIAFSGGGAKGIAHIGTIRALEENGVKIEAVSGTSAGAITALPYALGYSPDKIATIVVGYDFTYFLQESLLNKSPILSTVAKLSSSSRALMYRSDYFENFVKELKKPLLKYLILKNKHEKILDIKYSKDMSIEERMNHLDDHIINGNISLEQRRKIYSAATETDLNSILNIAEQKAMKYFIKRVEANEKDINPRELKEKLSLGFKNHEEALKTFFRISKSEDVIEEFFGDLIERKISAIPNEILEQVEEGFSSLEKIRNMNFKQFEKLRELCPDRNFKELGICICRKESDLPHKLFSKDNYKQIDVHANSEDKEYSEMSIKTAVRISMNLPGAFSSYKYKGKSYVDGGVRANFPLHFFDKTKKAVKETTIGFALAPEENYARTTDINNLCNPESPVELMETGPFKRFIKKQFIAASHFYNRKIYGQKLDNNEPFIQSDLLRVGFINVLNVGTNDFNISMRGKQKLMQQGYNSCKDLLSPRYEAQLFHYKERVRAINNKINHIEGLLMNIDKSKGNTKNEDFIKELECENKYNILEHLNNPKINEIIEREEKKQSFTKKIKGKRL